jgi:hypothetical protein
MPPHRAPTLPLLEALIVTAPGLEPLVRRESHFREEAPGWSRVHASVAGDRVITLGESASADTDGRLRMVDRAW